MFLVDPSLFFCFLSPTDEKPFPCTVPSAVLILSWIKRPMPAPKTTFRYKERHSRSWWRFINMTVKDACCLHGETLPCQFSDSFRQSGRQEGSEGCFLFLPYFFLEQNCAMNDQIINIPDFGGHTAFWKAVCPATEAKRQPQ